MMRIALLTAGSRGDIQPLVTLGKVLQARDHHVSVGAPAAGRVLVERAGLAYRPLPGDADAFLNHPGVIEALSKGPSRTRMIKALPKPQKDEVVTALKAAHDAAAGADLVIHTVLTMSVAFGMSEQPWCYLSTWPITATGDFPAMGFRGPGNLRAYNRLTHALNLSAEWNLWRRGEINMLRSADGLAPLPRRSRMGELGNTVPVFYPFSPAVVPPPPDWPTNTVVTGYWFADEELPERPEIDRFVDGGEPPIVLTLGSGWTVHRRLGTARTVVDAARALNRRTIMVDGPDDVNGPDVLNVHDVDFSRLFPRTSAVVHHGGFGTTGEVFRAGVPQVVFPTLADNPYWAGRVHTLGVGPRPLSVRRNDLAAVTAALDEALTSADMRARATELAARIGAEKGLTAACDAIDRLFPSIRR